MQKILVIISTVVAGLFVVGFGVYHAGAWFVKTVPEIDSMERRIRTVRDHPDACVEVASAEADDCESADFGCHLRAKILLRECLKSVHVPEEYCDELPLVRPDRWVQNRCDGNHVVYEECAIFATEELEKMCVAAPFKKPRKPRHLQDHRDVRATFEIDDANLLHVTVSSTLNRPRRGTLELRAFVPDGRWMELRCVDTKGNSAWDLPTGSTSISCAPFQLTPNQARYVRKVTARVSDL